MSGRWKYATETVTVGENSVKVRGMTFGERQKFAAARKDQKEKNTSAVPLTAMVAQMGAVDGLSDLDIDTMPGDLLAAVVEKVLELSGMKSDEKEAPAGNPEPAEELH